jgi:hypothetical protein
VTEFINLKIKPTQSFKCAHRDKLYVHVFIEVSAYTCISIYVYTVFLKNCIWRKKNTQKKYPKNRDKANAGDGAFHENVFNRAHPRCTNTLSSLPFASNLPSGSSPCFSRTLTNPSTDAAAPDRISRSRLGLAPLLESGGIRPLSLPPPPPAWDV